MNLIQLNSIIDKLQDSEAAFHVHYWGSVHEHYTHTLHKHSFFEYCYVTRGSGFYLDNGIRYELYPGDMFLSKPGVWHSIEGGSDGIGLVFLAFELKEELSVAEIVSGYRQLMLTERVHMPAETPSTAALLWQTLINGEFTGLGNQRLLQHLAFSLILSLLELFLDEESPQNKKTNPRESVILNQAKLFINDNLSIRIKFQDLAKHLHISERQLSRLFKDELGESFSDYYLKAKIHAATSRLEMTGSSLKQIAESTGFYSIHHFTKAFKQSTGFSPGQWRKMKQQ